MALSVLALTGERPPSRRIWFATTDSESDRTATLMPVCFSNAASTPEATSPAVRTDLTELLLFLDRLAMLSRLRCRGHRKRGLFSSAREWFSSATFRSAYYLVRERFADPSSRGR